MRKCHLCDTPTKKKWCNNSSCAEYQKDEQVKTENIMNKKLVFKDINVAMVIDNLVKKIDDNYMGSDDVINNQDAFRWDFQLPNDKMKYVIYLTNN